MKRFYSKLRIGLMTFALGLASVFMFQGSLYSDGIYVNLPEVKSDSVFIIIPKREICMPRGGGSHGYFSEDFLKQRELNCSPLKK